MEGTDQINDLPEVHLDATLIKIGETGRVMYELGELALPHLGSAIPEDEQQGVDGVGFTGTIRPDDRGERLDILIL